MSWSVSLFGIPDKVVAALENHSNDKMTGQSKVEWDEAKPHIIALVRQNFVTEEYMKQFSYTTSPLIKLDASGSGSSSGDRQLQRSCSIKIETIYTNLVL
jgi:hypothetical protein